MQINAEARDNFGRLKAKNVRTNALVPGTIYLQNAEIKHISACEKTLNKAIENFRFLNSVAEIILNGKIIRVLPKHIDFHPINGRILHIEFKEIPTKGNVNVLVPIAVENRLKSIGIKAGGKLNIVKHNVVVNCNPNNIPEKIVIDVEKYGIGRTVFTRNITTDGTYSFPDDVLILSIIGRGRKDKGEETGSNK